MAAAFEAAVATRCPTASVDRHPRTGQPTRNRRRLGGGDDPMRLGISRRVVADDGAYVRGGTP